MNEKMFNLHKKFLDMVDTFHDAEQEMQWYSDTVDELEVQLKHLENIEIGNHELELKNSRLENEAQSMAERITELEQTVLKQNELIVKQKQELDGLLSKHNTEVLKANTAINSLESQLNNSNRSRAYLEKKLTKYKKGLPADAEDWNAVKPIWKEGVESLYPTFAKTTFHDDEGNPVVLEQSYWWRHAKGSCYALGVHNIKK